MTDLAALKRVRDIAEECHSGVETGAVCSCRGYHEIIALVEPLIATPVAVDERPANLCNRKACRAEGAGYWNVSTREWYCEKCAKAINEGAGSHITGVRLCLHPADVTALFIGCGRLQNPSHLRATPQPSPEVTTRTEMDFKRLAEEAGEVVQAVMKVLRFGWRGFYDNGTGNLEQVETECGDFLAAMERCGLNAQRIEVARQAKHKKLARIAKYELGFDCELSREQREDLHDKATLSQEGGAA